MPSSLLTVITSILLKVFGLMPLALGRATGVCIGMVALCFNSRMSRVTAQNIAHCYPELSEAEQRQLVKSSMLETGKLAMEVAAVWTRPPSWVKKKILKVTHQELVTEALEQGQGVLVLAPHIGNWEVLGLYLAHLGPVTNLYQKPKNPAVEGVVKAGRSQSGARLVATDRRGLTQVLGALRKGEISGILPDQTPKDENSGIHVPFFNQPAFTMTLAHKLLQKSGARPVFGYAKRMKGGFEILFQEAPQDITSDNEADSVKALSEGVERCVRAIPDQYQWEYKRFKRRPSGEPNPYS